MALQEETPECLHIGPPLDFDDTEHAEERQAEEDHFEYGCSICSFRDGCRWYLNARLHYGTDEDWEDDEE